MRLLATIVVISLLAGCNPKARGPAPIAADDSCAYCRMLISDHRYAAELVDTDGAIYKFDDIACMLRFAQSRGKASASMRFYVTDFAGGGWLDARQAIFLRLDSSSSSPMTSGLVAFQSRQEAGRTRERGSAGILSFDEAAHSPIVTAQNAQAGVTGRQAK